LERLGKSVRFGLTRITEELRRGLWVAGYNHQTSGISALGYGDQIRTDAVSTSSHDYPPFVILSFRFAGIVKHGPSFASLPLRVDRIREGSIK
jgi:hypothetical protein